MRKPIAEMTFTVLKADVRDRKEYKNRKHVSELSPNPDACDCCTGRGGKLCSICERCEYRAHCKYKYFFMEPCAHLQLIYWDRT